VTALLVALAAIVFVACLGFIERLWQRHELKRTVRQWDEREQLLDRPVATWQDIVESQEHSEHLSQENEGVRAEVDDLEAKIARISLDNDRLRAERDELRALCRRLADLVDQVRPSRGG
jgi:predicted nuclease with TOPRIM domain